MSVYDPPAITPMQPRASGRTRLKRLRLVAILFALGLLGIVSFVFGMFVSIVSDLPSLTHFAQYKNEQASYLYDDDGHQLGILTQQNRVIVTGAQIPPIVKDAVVSIEDKRFWTNSGVDMRSVARAFVDDITRRGAGLQGGSTIEEQFIKNALQAQSHRTIFEKLREAALAYQLSHKWSKEKILTAYLNTIYFGNGAYGIEAAAQTYFGHEPGHEGCGQPEHELCVEQLQPAEAALLAGMIQSPTDYNPTTFPQAARERRDVVLAQMLAQRYITKPVYRQSIAQEPPKPAEIEAPQQQTLEGVDAGYFTSWVAQQVVERYGPERAYDGGLHIKTTLNLELQKAAERAVETYLANSEGPTASLVAIENSTGDVRAMVGGRDYAESPFNLATEGERQPGSSFKAFDLAAALEDGISPYSVWPSKEKEFNYKGPNGIEHFVVHNDEGAYSGENTLIGATAFSDNSIYAEVGLRVGTRRIAAIARRMGITTPISTNASMTIGGLTIGVTPLDMAHAYETLAHGGERVSGTLAEGDAPVGIQEVSSPAEALPDGSHRDRNHVRLERVLAPSIAETETSMLETVVQYGTGRAAAIGQFAAGKTGTTSNYGDAWFVGWDSKYTVAVWVGFPNKLIPMTYAFEGGPVLGGTFPALIWHEFMVSAIGIEKEQQESAAARAAGGAAARNALPLTGAPSSAGAKSAPAQGAGGGGSKAPSKSAAGGPTSAPSTGSEQHGSSPATSGVPSQSPSGEQPSSGSSGSSHPSPPGSSETGGASAPP